jgi:hypothetical protein
MAPLLHGHAGNDISVENWTVVAGFVVFMVAVASFFEGLLRLHEFLANPLDDQLCSWNVEDMIEALHLTSRQTACQQVSPPSCSVAGCCKSFGRSKWHLSQAPLMSGATDGSIKATTTAP